MLCMRGGLCYMRRVYATYEVVYATYEVVYAMYEEGLCYV